MKTLAPHQRPREYHSWPEHSPCVHFASAGYDLLLSRADWTQCPDDEECDNNPLAMQHWQDRVVLDALRSGYEMPVPKRKKKPEEPEQRSAVELLAAAEREAAEGSAKEEWPTLCGVLLDWHTTLPRLKTWAGRMTLEGIIERRVQAISSVTLPCRPVDWQLGCGGTSGIDPRSVVGPLDAGFSTDSAGINVLCYAVSELLAFIGLQIVPITRFARDEYGYVAGTNWWSFHVYQRHGTQYFRQFGMSRPKTYPSPPID